MQSDRQNNLHKVLASVLIVNIQILSKPQALDSSNITGTSSQKESKTES